MYFEECRARDYKECLVAVGYGSYSVGVRSLESSMKLTVTGGLFCLLTVFFFFRPAHTHGRHQEKPTKMFVAWKIEVKKVVLSVLIRVAWFVDFVLFDVIGLSGPWLLRRLLVPARLRRIAVRLSGVEEEKYHLSIEEMDRRLRRSVDAVASMGEESKLKGCGRHGRTLRLGLAAVRALERRLVRQLVVDLLVTLRKNDQMPEDPLVIVGPQRSGTTILFELLGLDSDNWRQLLTHEATLPIAKTKVSGALLDAGHEWLAGSELILDSVKHVHHERWDGPVECRAALENGVGAPHVLWYVFGATKSLDSYLLSDEDRFSDYEFYKKQLGALEQKKRWLLKDPAHCFSLDALFKAFPKATVIWMHRSPEKSAPSLCSLMSGLWRGLLREEHFSSLEPPNFHASVVEYLATMLDRATAYRAQHPNAKIIDVAQEDLREHPLKVIDRIYSECAQTMSPAARHNMIAFLDKENNKQKQHPHIYRLEDFGLQEGIIKQRFKNYINAPFFPVAAQ